MIKHKSVNGNIDKAELKEILSSKGSAVISKIQKEKVTTAELIEAVRSNNIFAPLDTDRVIKYVALSTSSKIDMNAIEKEFGVYLDSFENQNKSDTVCVLSGLSYPFERLLAMKKKVMANQEDIKKNIEATKINKLDDGDFNFINSPKKEAKSPDEKDADSIFSKYMK